MFSFNNQTLSLDKKSLLLQWMVHFITVIEYLRWGTDTLSHTTPDTLVSIGDCNWQFSEEGIWLNRVKFSHFANSGLIFLPDLLSLQWDIDNFFLTQESGQWPTLLSLLQYCSWINNTKSALQGPLMKSSLFLSLKNHLRSNFFNNDISKSQVSTWDNIGRKVCFLVLWLTLLMIKAVFTLIIFFFEMVSSSGCLRVGEWPFQHNLSKSLTEVGYL